MKNRDVEEETVKYIDDYVQEIRVHKNRIILWKVLFTVALVANFI